MHLDLSRGKGKTEVSFLNGAVARFGREVGVPTPVNQVLTDVLEGLAAGRLAWDDFRRQPERLLAEVGTTLDVAS
jgi:2-dehydropantoate 2-reductase